MFDDDWEASIFLYERGRGPCPPITLLVVAVADNVIFDPSKEELAVAESALAVSVAEVGRQERGGEDGTTDTSMDVDGSSGSRRLKLLSIRMIDPPSRLTPPGVPNGTDSGTGAAPASKEQQEQQELGGAEGVWKAPVGGTKFAVIDGIIQSVLEKGGVADEVLDGLKGVELA